MIRAITIAALLAIAPAAAADSDEDSDDVKVMFARADGFHRIAGDGVAHCSETRAERCRPFRGRPNHQACTYREAGKQPGTWIARQIEIELVDEDWRWVSGEVGHCNLTVYGD